MPIKVCEIIKGAILDFEAPFTIPANANLSTLFFKDILAKGLVYTKGTAVLTYNDGTGSKPIVYWNGVGSTPTAPYYKDNSFALLGLTTVSLELFDPTSTDVLFSPKKDTHVSVILPVVVDEIPAGTLDPSNGLYYFTNEFTIIVDGTSFTSDKIKIYFAKYKCEIYGGEDTVARIKDNPTVIKTHIPTIYSEANPKLKYIVTVEINPALAPINPSKTANPVDLNTFEKVFIRYAQINGPLVPVADYSVAALPVAPSREIKFTIPHNAQMKDSYLYIFLNTKLVDTMVDTPILSKLYFEVTLDGETLCENFLNHTTLNLKSLVKIGHKILL